MFYWTCSSGLDKFDLISFERSSSLNRFEAYFAVGRIVSIDFKYLFGEETSYGGIGSYGKFIGDFGLLL